jgi:hypothetical protein
MMPRCSRFHVALLATRLSWLFRLGCRELLGVSPDESLPPSA